MRLLVISWSLRTFSAFRPSFFFKFPANCHFHLLSLVLIFNFALTFTISSFLFLLHETPNSFTGH